MEHTRIEIKGVNYGYRHCGKGEAVVLLHGITTNSLVWQNVVPFLESKYSIYSFDLLGCGISDKTVEVDYSIKNQASLIIEALKKLGLSKVHLAAHDVGGGIAQIMAVNSPGMFKSVTLVNSVAFDFWPVQPIIAMRTPIIRQIAISTLDLGMLKMIVKRGLFHKEKLTTELMGKFNSQMSTAEGRKAFLHFVRCLNNSDLLEIEEELKTTKIPFQIIRGEYDVYLSKEISDKLYSVIPNSKLKTIDTAGHFAMIDEPEKIANYLKEFWSEVDE
ncbi:MAG: alpha/beta hydrolase [Ignavibacteria bacterium]|nr:MAG: alpha/beta hydrolase [Ignavibacteria bacterium]